MHACIKHEVTIMQIWIYHSVPWHTEHSPVLYLLYIRINMSACVLVCVCVCVCVVLYICDIKPVPVT